MNRINQIFELNNKERYLVLRQAVYKNKNYYITVMVDNEENFKDKFIMFEDDSIEIKEVKDNNIRNLILKYLNLIS